ncbi:MAG TPA: nitrite/sulfite reductase, partial [Candidatus Hydrogenedentes bacterium]|nr:nitrite/sulfite reductase [Candidatus Hydrogenedentota bacterium]
MTENAIYRLPATLTEDLDNLRAMTSRFKAGSISAAEFRAFRVPLGVYEQRKEGAFMLRVRLPAGGVLPRQMRTLAAVSKTYGNGILHVTTRQDIQVHEVTLDGIHPALVQLADSGLCTKGGGGNTVRNITACCDAGVCANEVFDVSPYAVALTEFLMPDPLSYQLPRKYKIAFSGCTKDCAGATVNDLGCIAKRRGDKPGFAVYVGGGLGTHSRIGRLLEPFVPADEIHVVAEAIKRVFDKHGNRKDRHTARLRFLVEQIGFDRFRTLYEAESAALRESARAKLQPRGLPSRTPCPTAPGTASTPEFEEWRKRNVLPQRQNGYYRIQVSLFLGDIASDALEKLSEVVERHGDGMARTTQEQNLVVRWVHEDELSLLHRELAEIGLALAAATVLCNATACAGASTCRLGICLSRGLVCAIRDRLIHDGLDLDRFRELRIRVSGCPNACGRHPVADIGLFGTARRINGQLVPHYVLQLGGSVEEGATRLAQGKQAIPARSVPAVVAGFLRAYAQSPEYPNYGAFLEARGTALAERLAAEHKQTPSLDGSDVCRDWGAGVP